MSFPNSGREFDSPIPHQMNNQHEGLRTWIEVSRGAIAHNYGEFRKLLKPTTMLMAVVKSNAYGHGLWDFALEMQKLGADWLGVDSIVEGVRLREKGVIIPLLVLGYTLPERLEDALKYNISLGVSTFDTLGQLRARQDELPGIKIHVKSDTGMHRQGFLPRDVPALLAFLSPPLPASPSGRGRSHGLVVEGLFTHFGSVDNPRFPNATKEQIECFKKVIAQFHEAGFQPIVHSCNTGGALSHPEAHFDMVRVGKGLYGYFPSPETRAKHAKSSRFNLDGRLNLELRPVLGWKTLVGEIKRLPDGGYVGYDGTELVPPGTVLAVLPVGYWHGYMRKVFSGVGRVRVRGQSAKVVGRVSMDITSVDVTHIPGVVVGDEVALLDSYINADEIAGLTETINYEVLTHINPLIKRVYTD